MTSRNLTNLADSIPEEIRTILGPPPLIAGESLMVYYATLAGFAEFVAPSDLITWFIIKDLADSRANITRYRNLQRELFQAIAAQSLAKTRRSPEPIPDAHDEFAEIMDSVHNSTQTLDEVVENYKRMSKEFREDADRPESGAGVSLEGNLDLLAKLESLLMAEEQRFAMGCQELERRRKGLGSLVRDDVIEGEIIETKPLLAPDRRRGTIARSWPKSIDRRSRARRSSKVS